MYQGLLNLSSLAFAPCPFQSSAQCAGPTNMRSISQQLPRLLQTWTAQLTPPSCNCASLLMMSHVHACAGAGLLRAWRLDRRAAPHRQRLCHQGEVVWLVQPQLPRLQLMQPTGAAFEALCTCSYFELGRCNGNRILQNDHLYDHLQS